RVGDAVEPFPACRRTVNDGAVIPERELHAGLAMRVDGGDLEVRALVVPGQVAGVEILGLVFGDDVFVVDSGYRHSCSPMENAMGDALGNQRKYHWDNRSAYRAASFCSSGE